MTYTAAIEAVTRVVEVLGVAVLVIGVVLAFVRGGFGLLTRKGLAWTYDDVRRLMARAILLGLELLVAADLIRTVAVQPTLSNVLSLAVVVLVRTLLSFSMQVELEGVLPWRRVRVTPEAAKEG